MGVTCHACIGGTNVRDDIKRLEAGVQIVVGTPGRVYDMLNRSALRMYSIIHFGYIFHHQFYLSRKQKYQDVRIRRSR